MSTTTSNESLEDYRLGRFLELRFTYSESKLLAEGRDSDGWPVSIHKVEKMLEAGCTHQLAMQIVL